MDYENYSDHELMAAFQSGEQDAFSVLYERHLKALLNFFFKLSWDRSLAEDFTQETLIRVFRMAKDWSPKAKFTTFLYRVGRNLWIDHLRSAKVRKSGGSLDAPVGSDERSGAFVDLLPADVRPPEDAMARREVMNRVMEALEELPNEQRMVFVLAEIEGMKYLEISEIMDIPVGTVKSRMHSAVGKLQRLLTHLAPKNHSSLEETSTPKA